MFVTKLIYDLIFRRRPSKYDALQNNTGELYIYPGQEGVLAGYLYRASEKTKNLVVVVPGFNAEAERYSGVVRCFAEAGYDVFCFDCTGCGNSCGNSAFGFPQVINDLNDTLDFIETSNVFNYDNIFLFGHSRGGYAACCVVNEHPCISGVIAINGVNRAMDGVMACSIDAVGTVAYGNYGFLWLYQTMIFGKDVANRYATKELSKCSIPVMIIQSAFDELIPTERFSIYAQRDRLESSNVQFFLYCCQGKDGHTSVVYDRYGIPNKDIVRIASDFFGNIPERRRRKGEKHSGYTRI